MISAGKASSSKSHVNDEEKDGGIEEADEVAHDQSGGSDSENETALKDKKRKHTSLREEEDNESGSEDETYNIRPSQSRTRSLNGSDDPRRFLGVKVRIDVFDKKKNKTSPYDATVVSHWEDEKSHSVCYHVEFTDGDEADLSLSELLDAIEYFKNP